MNIEGMITYIFRAHSEQAKKPKKTIRYWDGKTPYAIHPTWCAMTLLTETNLQEYIRFEGAQALLLHDILEDTNAKLPDGISARVHHLVLEMTFESSAQEMELVWSRSDLCQLLKLYDKVSNLLDGAWMSAEKRAKYVAYTKRLAAKVEATYGSDLNILRIAKAICV